MTASFHDEIEHYEAYARHCLTLASQTADRSSRLILREMAAEWLKLAMPGGCDGEPANHASPANDAHHGD